MSVPVDERKRGPAKAGAYGVLQAILPRLGELEVSLLTHLAFLLVFSLYFWLDLYPAGVTSTHTKP